MKQFRLLMLASVLSLLPTGCGVGILYTHTTIPLTLDMHHTKIVSTSGQGDIKHIQIAYIGAAWGDASIGSVAKKYGLHELYFADLERLSVLTIWNQYTLHLYGQ